MYLSDTRFASGAFLAVDREADTDVSELTREQVQRLCREYEREEPFYAVENERLETMPAAVRQGSLSWKDAEWLVRWYYRRHLTSAYNERRTATESGFRENDWGDVRNTLEIVIGMDDPAERVAQVAALQGTDVGVASGVLYFLDPEDDIVMGEPEWRSLEDLGERTRGYPEAARPSDYHDYRATCARLRDDLSVSFIELQRALWRLSSDSH